MTLKDDILKVWDKALAGIDDPTDEQLAAATAEVCAKCPGVTPDDINNALRSDIENVRRDVVSADRLLRVLKGMLANENDARLPGLPGGPSLKH